jgi:Protein of unknown function (DUF1203)
MPLRFQALPTDHVRALQAGGKDANGLAAERTVSDGNRNPCRHCLTEIDRGAAMLVLAYRPFPSMQPYAEVGPIFLCADRCRRHRDTNALPSMFRGWDRILVRGYTTDHRIKYGTGQVIDMTAVESVAARMFSDDTVAYVHMRSASNNCYQCRIERA